MSDPQELDELRSTVRRFFNTRAEESVVRQLMEDEVGYSPETWRQMAQQLGLQGLAIAEDLGGSGFSFVEQGVVFEEMGRCLLPSPFLSSVALVASTLHHCDDHGAQERYLPGIAAGETLATLAVAEGVGGWERGAVAVSARKTAEGWSLTGQKRFVPDLLTADLILVVARSDRGVSLFAVDAGAEGVARVPERTMDLTRRLGNMDLVDTPAVLIGDEGAGWRYVTWGLMTGAVALAAEATGGAEKLLEMTTEYAGQRYQFGRSIGSFQVIKHRLADMLVRVQASKAAVEDAAAALEGSEKEAALAASVAKVVCCDNYFRSAGDSIQIHGGIGFTWEHPAHLYFKRAKSSQLLLGSSSHHRQLIGTAIGL